MKPQEVASRFHELTARRDELLASLQPQEAVVSARVDEIEALNEVLRPLAKDLSRKKAPLYAIDMERAEIARQLSGKTGGRTFPRTPRTGAEIIPFTPAIDVDALAFRIAGPMDELSARIEAIEGVKDQTLSALEMILKTIEIERQKRKRLEEVILTLAERADETLRDKD